MGPARRRGFPAAGCNRYTGEPRLRGAPRTKVAPRNRIGIAAVRTANARFFAQKPDHARNA
ncbi:hypothetical protein D8O30_25465 [Burkholderia mallei]|nr:hypothetical protein D8O30_25465 [Burkholderia mallei]